MNLSEAASMSREAMNDNGLGHWTFQWDRSRSRFGVCKHGPRVISMSEHLVKLNDRANVLDTVLHEIAHALAGPGAGHGPLWKAKCREVGANPERCYDSATVATPPAPWVGICEHCGPVAGRHRRPKSLDGWKHKRCGGSIAFRQNREGWTKHKEATAMAASGPASEATPGKARPAPALDADAKARIAARAAARAADINKRLGI
jgi:hypothetical protein